MQPAVSHRASAMRSSAIRDLLANAATPGMLSLAGGLPDSATFPRRLLAGAMDELLADGSQVLQYSTSEGDQRLRRHIAVFESERRQQVVDPSTVVVTTGSQQALSMAATVLADPGDVIAVPHPAYLGALQTFAAAGLQTHPVRVGDGRLDLDQLEADLRAGVPIRVMYVVANHANPDGHRLDDDANARLGAIAERWGMWLLEDDPYRQLWFDAPPALGLAAYTANVVALGSFSKTVAPGLRVGWLSTTGAALTALVRTKQSADLHTSTLSQALVVALLDTPGWFAAHTQMLRGMYASRRDVLCDALGEAFGSRIRFDRPSGGMFAWAELDGIDTDRLLGAALANGVCFVPGVEFASGGKPLDNWLRLSFATLDAPQLREAVRRLAVSVDELDGVDRRVAISA